MKGTGMAMFACPSTATLARWTTDALDGPAFASLAEHIDACDGCRAKLDRLRRNDAEMEKATPALPGPSDPPRIPGFEIERELGRGGMGVVYQALQPSLKRRVALKVVRSGPGSGSRDHTRWLREARSFSRVRHDNVVRLYQVGESDGWLYLVLELVPGGTLKDRLEVPYAAKDAARLLETIARAVAAIHGEGLVHLDLKPSNILLDAGLESPRELATPRVADFGLAYRWDDPDASLATTSLAGPLGTPSYMAPEQFAGDRSQIGPAADIHGLGALLYHLLTGRAPFAAPSVAETLDQVRDQDPVQPRRLNPTIPRDLETICLKCLEKDPGRRYASAEALAGDLRRFLDGNAISARPVSRFERTWRWCRRRPAIASLITALTLTLLSGFVGLFVLLRISEAERGRAESERARTEEALRLTEDNEKLVSSALAELNDALFFALRKPEPLSEDRILATTRSLRKQTSDLKNYRRLAPRSLHGLGVLERELAARLFSRGKRAEATALLIDSVAVLKECRQLDPVDENILWQLAESLWLSGDLAAAEHRIDEALDFCDQASSLLGALRTLVFRVDMTKRLYLMRRRLADDLTRRGESKRARQVIEANLRVFDSMDYTLAEQPELAVCKELALADLTPGLPALKRLHSAARKFPDDLNLRKELKIRTTTWLTDPLFFTNSTTPGLTRYEDDPDAWAESLVSSIRWGSTALGLDECAVPNVALGMMDPAISKAAEQRRIGRLGDAEVTVGRLMAFARRLVQHYPSQPESHLVLSQAHFQMSKNPWKREDYAAIEQALRKALESARYAVSLNPEHENARQLVKALLPRLALFDTGRSKPK